MDVLPKKIWCRHVKPSLKPPSSHQIQANEGDLKPPSVGELCETSQKTTGMSMNHPNLVPQEPADPSSQRTQVMSLWTSPILVQHRWQSEAEKSRAMLGSWWRFCQELEKIILKYMEYGWIWDFRRYSHFWGLYCKFPYSICSRMTIHRSWE